ncbi:probable UDP-sugar transporter protein SLC35A5 isoform X5 [Pipistrellus kuhlii]|uniref:probable UDP-sugar transporter protein SLC35A5 isoform X5 n=1 Tax=Pipistrellus kuhlii TaxID=59472 RepID=UPI00174F269F|nr:probable UDP-sugar transporter protein SLC35A5 isoform X5 [Pipistrellus kuhlii]
MESKCCGHPKLSSLSTMYTFFLGAIFIALSSSRILLVKYSANEENKYDYLPTTVNVCSELVKLVFCMLVSFWVIKKESHQSRNLKCASWKEFFNFMKWSIPAFLYFLDNLIVFYVLSYLQPAMAVIFSNFSIITTALLFRIVLKRNLNWIQWASLLILFLCIVALTAGTKTSQHNLAGHGFHHDAFFSPSNSCLVFRKAPSALLAVFIYNASKSQDMDYRPRQERFRDLSGHLWERSSGDGEELERLTKPKNAIESDEDTF